MLSPDVLERIAGNLVKAGLSSGLCFTVGVAIGAAILERDGDSSDVAGPCRFPRDSEDDERAHKAKANGAAVTLPQGAGNLTARAAAILEERPDISPEELASALGCGCRPQNASRPFTARPRPRKPLRRHRPRWTLHPWVERRPWRHQLSPGRSAPCFFCKMPWPRGR
jgi:hypothetical protein